MASIIKGTTPTIQFTFNFINPANITVAYLTVKQDKVVIIERDKSTAVVGDKTISWRLSQEETLQFIAGRKIAVMHNWLLNDGTRGASKEAIISVEDNHKDEVIG